MNYVFAVEVGRSWHEALLIACFSDRKKAVAYAEGHAFNVYVTKWPTNGDTVTRDACIWSSKEGFCDQDRS